MVNIRENKLVIEVETFSPSETLNNYQHAIIQVLKMATKGEEEIQDPQHIHFLLDLLEEMIPSPDEAASSRKAA